MSIGEYNKLSDLKYELSSFYQLTQKEISKINIFIDKVISNIIGLEFFYDSLSTGIFHNNNLKPEKFDINNNKDLVIKEIDLSSKTYNEIQSIYIENKILKLLFVSSQQNTKNGFNIVDYVQDIKEENIEILLPTLKKTNIDISSKKLTSFEFSFNEDGLTSIRPIFSEKEKLNELDENNKKYLKTDLFGKKFGDSKEYKLNPVIISEGYDLQKIIFYHDSHIMMGIQMFYKKNDKILDEKFGKLAGIENCLELNVDFGEKIEQVMLRTGDMMDGVMLKTNKGQIAIAGGNGGGEHFYNLNGEGCEKKLAFVGFEGSGAGTIHQVRMIVKEEE